MSELIRSEEAESLPAQQKANELNIGPALSPVLARLIEEVRNEEPESPNAYNRMHNRHNRSR